MPKEIEHSMPPLAHNGGLRHCGILVLDVVTLVLNAEYRDKAVPPFINRGYQCSCRRHTNTIFGVLFYSATTRISGLDHVLMCLTRPSHN
jgi:hypothetical protein